MKHLFALAFLVLLFGCSSKPVKRHHPEVNAVVEAETEIETDAETGVERNVTLVLGDSHMVGTYGEALLAHIRTKSDLLMIANCGAGSSTFTTTPIKHPCRSGKYKTVVVRREPASVASRLADPMASLAWTARELNPNIVVVGLGTNYGNNSSSSIRKLTEILARSAPAMTKLIWIGPPYFFKKGGDSTSVVNTIREAFGLAERSRGRYQTSARTIEVVFADSTNFNRKRRPLNIPKGDFHFSGKTTKGWADYTWAKINEEF